MDVCRWVVARRAGEGGRERARDGAGREGEREREEGWDGRTDIHSDRQTDR